MKHLLFAVTTCAALTLTGCGSNTDTKDADTASEPKGLTKAEFTAKANAICKAGTEALEAAEGKMFADPENPTDVEAKAAVENMVVPELKKQVASLRDLEAPAADADAVDAMLDSLEAEIKKVEADWEYIAAEESFADANKAATDLGLSECGEE